ncbi:hypothetical protein [Streptococcus merionis]|uniref:hypothetical protein n=1 Tax=Streptococcus merionis TaxID=400065 RepID=UPI0026EC8C84|nr:hypothetical protein [Streptococcus merionis]
MRLFQKKAHNPDCFKRLIHRLSAMSESELIKVEQLLSLVFESREGEVSLPIVTEQKEVLQEPTLDDTITEAKNKLHTEQLEKRIEQFKLMKKPK